MMVVFDWDGTLGNSIDAITKTLLRASQKEGFAELSVERYQSIIGLSLEAAAGSLYPELDDAAQARYAQAYRDSFDMSEAANLFAGAEDLLASLYQRDGVTLGVATGKSRQGLDMALESTGLAYMFAATVTASEAESKPSPDMLRQLAAQSSGDLLMIGDSVLDVAMGVAAEAYTIGVTWGVASEPQLKAAGADVVVASFAELRSELIKQGVL